MDFKFRKKSVWMLENKVVSCLFLQGVYTLKYDGASKGNPGRAGAGAVLLGPDGALVFALALMTMTGSTIEKVATSLSNQAGGLVLTRECFTGLQIERGCGQDHEQCCRV